MGLLNKGIGHNDWEIDDVREAPRAGFRKEPARVLCHARDVKLPS